MYDGIGRALGTGCFRIIRHMVDMEGSYPHEGIETIPTPIGSTEITGVGAFA